MLRTHNILHKLQLSKMNSKPWVLLPFYIGIHKSKTVSSTKQGFLNANCLRQQHKASNRIMVIWIQLQYILKYYGTLKIKSCCNFSYKVPILKSSWLENARPYCVSLSTQEIQSGFTRITSIFQHFQNQSLNGISNTHVKKKKRDRKRNLFLRKSGRYRS